MSDAILVRDVEAMAARLAAEGTTHETTVEAIGPVVIIGRNCGVTELETEAL